MYHVRPCAWFRPRRPELVMTEYKLVWAPVHPLHSKSFELEAHSMHWRFYLLSRLTGCMYVCMYLCIRILYLPWYQCSMHSVTIRHLSCWYVFMYECVCMFSVFVCIYMYVCMCVCIRILCVCVRVQMCVWMRVCDVLFFILSLSTFFMSSFIGILMVCT